MVKKTVVWFDQVDKNDVGFVGGKGANLGEMVQASLPIPYGFIVTAPAYFYFLKKTKITDKIKALLEGLNFNDLSHLGQVAKVIRRLIINSPIPPNLVDQILEYYENLEIREEKIIKKNESPLKKIFYKTKNIYSPPLVAVRSSATAEDLPTASFAGQQETYLNVKGESQLIKKIKECWASLFTERAIFYRHQQGFDHLKIGLAAVVQRMVESDKSGVAFSIDPVTNDRSKIVIEAIFGLGEYIVQGKVTPDHYEVSKRSFVILKKEAHRQRVKYIRHGRGNMELKLTKGEGLRQKLSDKEILEVANLVKRIEAHYYFPQDIEWAIERNRVYIVQSRPITTLKGKKDGLSDNEEGKKPILTGAPASPGIGIGPIIIIRSPKEIDKVHKGDVLVAPQTDPDYVPAMKKAAAIITERGGRTSHAAIVSRELGIPAIVGVEKATKILKKNLIVTVNGKSGQIFKGSLLAKNKPNIGELHKKKLKTLTRIYVNLAEPEAAERVAKMDVDGIGLLRAEFMIAQIGTHPKQFIKEKKQAVFINKLTNGLKKFVVPFSPRPVVYRATDFKTNEYRHLRGGKQFEPQEENPMLGFRGAARYIADPQVFLLELQAIKNIWQAGYRNLHLMIPFIRTPWELVKIRNIVEKNGLFDFPEFKFWIMVEVPACAINLNAFIKIGIDGVSVGTNDLTMMLLGLDRDNETIANIYDERNPVVMGMLKHIVNTARKNKISCSICGQAASDYQEIVEMLVNEGITSLSVTPDAVDRTRELVYKIEKKRFHKNG